MNIFRIILSKKTMKICFIISVPFKKIHGEYAPEPLTA